MWVLQSVNDARSPNEKILHIAIYITMLRKFSTLFWCKHLLREFIDMNNTPKAKPLPGYSECDPIELNNMVCSPSYTLSPSHWQFLTNSTLLRYVEWNGMVWKFCEPLLNPSARFSLYLPFSWSSTMANAVKRMKR